MVPNISSHHISHENDHPWKILKVWKIHQIVTRKNQKKKSWNAKDLEMWKQKTLTMIFQVGRWREKPVFEQP